MIEKSRGLLLLYLKIKRNALLALPVKSRCRSPYPRSLPFQTAQTVNRRSSPN